MYTCRDGSKSYYASLTINGEKINSAVQYSIETALAELEVLKELKKKDEEKALEEDRIFWENWHEKNDCLNL